MCLCVLLANYCVMFYGVFCSCCLFVRCAFACVACGVLCDVVLIVFCLCVGVLLIRLRGVFLIDYALSYGLCLCCGVFVRVGLNVLVRVVDDLLCDVV